MQNFFSLGYVWKSETRLLQLLHPEHQVIFILMAGQYMSNSTNKQVALLGYHRLLLFLLVDLHHKFT